MINKTLFESAIAKESIVKQKLEIENVFSIKDNDLYYKDYLVLAGVPNHQHVIFDGKNKAVLFRERTNIYKWQFNELNQVSLLEYDIYLTSEYHSPKCIHSTICQKEMNEFGQLDCAAVIYDNTDIEIELPYTSFENYKKYSYNKHKHLTPIYILLEGAYGRVVIDENNEFFIEYNDNDKDEQILHVRYNHSNNTYSFYRTSVNGKGYNKFESPILFEDITEFEKIVEYEKVDNFSHTKVDRYFFLLDSSSKKYMVVVLKDGYDSLREIETINHIDSNLTFEEYIMGCKHVFTNNVVQDSFKKKVPKHVIEYIIENDNIGDLEITLGNIKEALYTILEECPDIYYKYLSTIKQLTLSQFVARFADDETLAWFLSTY